MSAWLGTNENSYASQTLRILSIGYFFNIITSVITSMGRGIGVLNYEMYATAFIAAANLILSVTLIITIGFIGALIGTSVSMTVGNILYLYRFNRYMGISFSNFLKFAFFKPVFSAAVAGTIIHYSQNLVLTFNLNFSVSRVYMIIYLGLMGLIFAIVYSLGLFLTGSIKRSDFEIFSQLIASIRPAIWKADIN
jgi:O-antigen/teichoic acid export membrane protein